eukprot:tig00000821_g4466.t1
MGNAAGLARTGSRPAYGQPAYDIAENIVNYIKTEFNRVRSGDNSYVVLEELLRMKPLREIPIEFTHLGTLFVLDSNRDGRITLDELFAFAEIFGKRQRLYKAHEYEMQMRAYCTLRMWSVVSAPGGIDSFVDWMCNLFSESMPVQHFERHPDEVFLNRDVVKTMHEILTVKASYGIEFQDFFDLMQRVAEEMGAMNLEEDELDDVVPVSVLRLFCADFARGFVRLMAELGFPDKFEFE